MELANELLQVLSNASQKHRLAMTVDTRIPGFRHKDHPYYEVVLKQMAHEMGNEIGKKFAPVLDGLLVVEDIDGNPEIGKRWRTEIVIVTPDDWRKLVHGIETLQREIEMLRTPMMRSEP